VHRQAGADPLLECVPTQAFLEVEDDVVRLLPELEAARDADDAQARADALLGPGVDLGGLVATLRRAGFVDDAQAAPTPPQPALARHVERAAAAVGRALIHPWVGVLGTAAIVAYVAAAAVRPGLRPNTGAIFAMSQQFHQNIVFSMGGLLGVAFLHELAHYMVAAAYGVRGKVTANNRLYLIVLQTDVTGAWRLPRGARARIFLAGMFFNLLMVSLAGLALLAGSAGWAPWAVRHALALQYWMALNYFPLLFQLMIYMRTDLYYLVALLSGNRNLSADARLFGQLVALKATLWIMGAEREPCPACGRSMLNGELACLQCGELAPGGNPNMVPLKGQSMRWLMAFWMINTVGMAYMILRMRGVGSRFVMLLARAFYEVDLDPTHLWGIVLQALSLALIVMNIVFLARFVLSLARRAVVGSIGLVLFLLRAYRHRRFPYVASPVLALLDVVDAGSALLRSLADRIPLHRLPIFLQTRIPLRPVPTSASPT